MRFYVSLDSPKEVWSSAKRWLAVCGGTCILAVIVGGSLQLGNVTLPAITSPPRQIAIGVIGAVLILSSFVSVESAGRVSKTGVLNQPEFWLQVFEAMPPAFIKEYPSDTHVADNQALRTFQGNKPRSPIDTTELHTLINFDHKQGDSIAATTGTSVQLELSDQFTTKYPQLILTFKTRIEFGDRVYIAGWYVPIESAGALSGKEVAGVKKRGEQVLFQVLASHMDQESPFIINVGRAIGRSDSRTPSPARWRRRS